MSFFYLTPARGDMPVYLLDEILVQRCHYLSSVIEGEPLYTEYVIDGSVYDNVGHFMLCVVSSLGRNNAFTQFFLKAEVKVFRNRLSSLSAYDLRCFARKLLRSLKKEASLPFFLEPLYILCQHMMLKDLAQHLCSQTHNKLCNSHSIDLHFKHCLSLLAKREVEIQKGIVSLHCGKWKDFLLSLFKNNLLNKIQKTDLSPLSSDPRISELIFKVNNEIHPSFTCNSPNMKLLCKDVDNASESFPPCMLNLHRCLRRKHRLSHYQRFYYSLFLKDIGMPVDEAINFWRIEYSQHPNGSHSCSHNWLKDEKKYLYGIRHMYGLEGGRKTYTSVSCHQIQNLDKSCSEGGCPFTFDDPNMMQVLNMNPNDPRLTQINEFKRNGQCMSACKAYLRSVTPKDCDNVSFNYTPVNYFKMAYNIPI